MGDITFPTLNPDDFSSRASAGTKKAVDHLNRETSKTMDGDGQTSNLTIDSSTSEKNYDGASTYQSDKSKANSKKDGND